MEILTDAKIYMALGVDTNEPWDFVIRHGGLHEHVLYAGNPRYAYYTMYRPSSSKELHTWRGAFTQTLVEKDLVGLVLKIANSLLQLFGTHEISKETVERVLSDSGLRAGVTLANG